MCVCDARALRPVQRAACSEGERVSQRLSRVKRPKHCLQRPAERRDDNQLQCICLYFAFEQRDNGRVFGNILHRSHGHGQHHASRITHEHMHTCLCCVHGVHQAADLIASSRKDLRRYVLIE